MKQVVISVRGGVAQIDHVSEGVEVAIVDFDNAEAEGKSGKHKLAYWIGRALKDEGKPTTVHVAMINHKHGTDLYAALTREELDRQLYEYVVQWWEAEGFEGKIPADHKEAVEAYFEAMSEQIDGEYLYSDEIVVKG
jgi:hypothetical protein